MSKMHIKTGDTVMILSGKDRGQKGKVLEVSPKEGKVIIEGRNIMTKHVKARKPGDPAGIVKAEGAMYASKVVCVCPKCGKPTRVSHKVNVAVDANGKKNRTMVRVCKKCGADID